MYQFQVSFFKGIPDTYQFLDMNGWPISKQLESATKVAETAVNSCVVVCTDLCKKTEESADEVDGANASPNQEPPRKRLRS
jgi:hypothetical protein